MEMRRLVKEMKAVSQEYKEHPWRTNLDLLGQLTKLADEYATKFFGKYYRCGIVYKEVSETDSRKYPSAIKIYDVRDFNCKTISTIELA